MTDDDRRIAALAAAFAAERASRLVSRLSGSAAPDAACRAADLAASPREERLRALSGALVFAPDPARVEAVAAQERPAVGAVLRALSADGCAEIAGASPLLMRLCRERLGR